MERDSQDAGAGEDVVAAVPNDRSRGPETQSAASRSPGGEGSGESSSDDDEGFQREMAHALELMQSRMRGLRVGDDQQGRVPPPEPLLSSFDVKGIAELIRDGRAKLVVIMVGAGISVNAGIPEFCSKGTGLYDNLQKYDLPYPQAIFELDYFRSKPGAFYHLAKEMWPDGRYKPTLSHYFLCLMHRKGILLRCFSQNIDSLEVLAGLPASSLVAAHGNFDGAACIDCDRAHPREDMLAAVREGTPMKCRRCEGLVKPTIVFFGESLPDRFSQLAAVDMPKADLLIVMGTSLVVYPFAGLVGRVEDKCPRLLINQEKVAEMPKRAFEEGARRGAFYWGEGNYRDALYLGDCDEGVREMCRELGWEEELLQLKEEGDRRLERELQEAQVKAERQPSEAKGKSGKGTA